MRVHPSTSDPRVIKAFSHPVRVQILESLETRVASPSELASEFGLSVGSVSYHVQQLVELGQLRLVDRVERRGALEHFYTLTEQPTLSDEAWATLPSVVKSAVLGHALAKAGAHTLAAAREGGFEHADIHFSRTALRLDPDAWVEVAAELAAMLKRIEEIGARSIERRGTSVEPEVREATVIMMLFEGPEDRRFVSHVPSRDGDEPA
jgi:DNA-binding transcriptional ArsR family regulator